MFMIIIPIYLESPLSQFLRIMNNRKIYRLNVLNYLIYSTFHMHKFTLLLHVLFGPNYIEWEPIIFLTCHINEKKVNVMTSLISSFESFERKGVLYPCLNSPVLKTSHSFYLLLFPFRDTWKIFYLFTFGKLYERYWTIIMYSALIINMRYVFLYLLYLCALGNDASANFKAKVFHLADYYMYFKHSSRNMKRIYYKSN